MTEEYFFWLGFLYDFRIVPVSVCLAEDPLPAAWQHDFMET